VSGVHVLEITRLAKQGEGVASHEGRAVFVEGALPGEQVRAELRVDGDVLRATVLERLSVSPDRRAPPCPVADRCGGCDWQHLRDEAQLRARVQIVQSTLAHLGQLPPDAYRLLPPLPAPRALGYRRRAVLHPFKADGAWRFGLFERHSHRGVPLGACTALVPELEALLPHLEPALAKVAADITALHLLSASGHTALSLELGGAPRPRIREQVAGLLRKAKVRGAVLVPKTGHPELLGKPELRAPAPLRPEVQLLLRPDAFSQASEAGNELLVGAALEALGAGAADEVLELYAGNGNFSFALAARAASVLAVESGPVSVGLGQKAAREAGISNLRFVQGDAIKVAQGLAGEGKRFPHLLVDPPRTGAPKLPAVARSLGVDRLVYVACDPAALARDARALLDAGFSPDTLQVVDLFPQTHHVESVMSFARGAPRG
jgi:23S rRNA (uracil1939-C5)-methyltransferase